MAKYQFSCKKCGDIEIEHPMTEKHPDKCPDCGGDLSRIFSNPGITFRGSGFYATDKILSEPTPDEVTEMKLAENAKDRLSRA